MKWNNNFFVVLSICVGFYFMFDLIFFDFLGYATSDAISGFSFFLLLLLIYKKGRRLIYGYLWSLTKNVYINFFTLLKLSASLRNLVIGYNNVYFEFLKYSAVAINTVSNGMSENFFFTKFKIVE